MKAIVVLLPCAARPQLTYRCFGAFVVSEMHPHDRDRPHEWRGHSAIHGDPQGPPGGSQVPDAFCCVHPSALEQRRQQGSGDWRLRATSKQVKSDSDLRRWLASSTHTRFLSFVGRLAKNVANKKSMTTLFKADIENRRMLADDHHTPSANDQHSPEGTQGAVAATAAAARRGEGVNALLSSFVPFSDVPSNAAGWVLLGVLRRLLQWTRDIEPIEQPTRFGNQAFKTWCTKLENVRLSLTHGDARNQATAQHKQV